MIMIAVVRSVHLFGMSVDDGIRRSPYIPQMDCSNILESVTSERSHISCHVVFSFLSHVFFLPFTYLLSKCFEYSFEMSVKM